MKIADFNNLLKSLKNDRFLGHSKYYLIAELFNKGLGFLTIPIFTRLMMPSDYGIVSVFTTIISIFGVLMALNIQSSIGRKYYDDDNEFGSFLWTNVIFLIFFCAFLFFVIYVLRGKFSEYFGVDNMVFLIAIIVSILNIFTDAELIYLQVSQQSKNYALISVVRNLIIASSGIFLVYFMKENRYYGRIYSQLICSFFIMFFSIYNIKKLFVYKFKIQHLKYSLSFGIPLIPHLLSTIILAQFDRVAINQIVGSYETGIYSFAYNVGSLMMIFVMALNNAWVPIFYQKLKNREYKSIQKEAEKYAKIVLIIALLFILFSKEIVIILADKKYTASLSIIPMIIWSGVLIFLYTLYANYAFYNKKTIVVSIATLISGFINIKLNYALIPIYGYSIAALTTLVSYMVMFALHYINVKYILKQEVIKLNRIVVNFLLVFLVEQIYTLFQINNFFIDIIFKSGLVLCVIFYFFKINKSKI